MIWIHKEDADNRYTVWLAGSEVPNLAGLPGRLRELLEQPDFSSKVAARLFPPAYRDDPEAEKEYQGLLRQEMVRRKLAGVEAFEKTLERRESLKVPLGPTVCRIELSGEELALWLGFLHDMRLVIGTGLDITDESWERDFDPDHPGAEEMLLMHRLAHMEEIIVQALREAEKFD